MILTLVFMIQFHKPNQGQIDTCFYGKRPHRLNIFVTPQIKITASVLKRYLREYRTNIEEKIQLINELDKLIADKRTRIENLEETLKEYNAIKNNIKSLEDLKKILTKLKD